MREPSEKVRSTCRFVAEQAKHVGIEQEQLEVFAKEVHGYKYIPFTEYECHLTKATPESVVDYLFILDSLNFCFWPQKDYEYDNLASSIKALIQKDPECVKPRNLLK